MGSCKSLGLIYIVILFRIRQIFKQIFADSLQTNQLGNFITKMTGLLAFYFARSNPMLAKIISLLIQPNYQEVRNQHIVQNFSEVSNQKSIIAHDTGNGDKYFIYVIGGPMQTWHCESSLLTVYTTQIFIYLFYFTVQQHNYGHRCKCRRSSKKGAC